ncbi:MULTISPECIES: SHOCT domain-containing protein [unclassified Caloramator]|uniref:SHOCT domain-containing protein n=1 Tax=unclassified Caloramator TaxID=2629145 RepID=UPI00237DDAD7|nr:MULTISPECIES: SHOCT domain-containing protein [unclassified Caloramator]MDO6355025.1 SHOCT domain-containing protein [Caloramator sp. CAR-1]WDU82396.1 SHOCT domain-containing protein [Caloramator sp. Dgby_cultured_2]
MHRGFKGFPGVPGFYGRGFEGGLWERGFGFHWIGLLMMLALILAAAVIIYFLIRRYMMNNNFALEMLNKKFVLGEITEDEYLRKKELILGKKIKKIYKEQKVKSDMAQDDLKIDNDNKRNDNDN